MPQPKIERADGDGVSDDESAASSSGTVAKDGTKNLEDPQTTTPAPAESVPYVRRLRRITGCFGGPTPRHRRCW